MNQTDVKERGLYCYIGLVKGSPLSLLSMVLVICIWRYISAIEIQ